MDNPVPNPVTGGRRRRGALNFPGVLPILTYEQARIVEIMTTGYLDQRSRIRHQINRRDLNTLRNKKLIIYSSGYGWALTQAGREWSVLAIEAKRNGVK